MNEYEKTPVNEFQGGTFPPSQRHCDQEVKSLDNLAQFKKDFTLSTDKITLLSVIDTVLKKPALLFCRIVNNQASSALAGLTAVALTSIFIYGLIVGCFEGGYQLWSSPVKITAGLILSCLICLPSLYIFTSLSGSKQSLAQTAGFLIVTLALTCILMLGFAPIAWIFSQSTDTAAFMSAMHIAFWFIAVHLGMRLLKTAFSFLVERKMPILSLWHIIFIVVTLQMCTVFRPIVGPFEGYDIKGKKFFLNHWGNTLFSHQKERVIKSISK